MSWQAVVEKLVHCIAFNSMDGVFCREYKFKKNGAVIRQTLERAYVFHKQMPNGPCSLLLEWLQQHFWSYCYILFPVNTLRYKVAENCSSLTSDQRHYFHHNSCKSRHRCFDGKHILHQSSLNHADEVDIVLVQNIFGKDKTYRNYRNSNWNHLSL